MYATDGSPEMIQRNTIIALLATTAQAFAIAPTALAQNTAEQVYAGSTHITLPTQATIVKR